MPPEIAGIEQGLPAPLHQQHIAVKRGVVTEIGGDRQRADLDGASVLQKTGRAGRPPPQILVCRPQHLPGPVSQVEGNIRMDLLRQAHVIPVSVGEKHRVTTAGLGQPGRLGRDVSLSFQGLSGVQQDLRAAAGHLDQISPDLVSSPENLRYHHTLSGIYGQPSCPKA